MAAAVAVLPSQEPASCPVTALGEDASLFQMTDFPIQPPPCWKLGSAYYSEVFLPFIREYVVGTLGASSISFGRYAHKCRLCKLAPVFSYAFDYELVDYAYFDRAFL